MPSPIIPPPLTDTGALTNPRQLQRWLDINRITKLDKTGTYITLPSFIQSANTWNGYSDIVLSFNCESPNNFSFSGVLTSSIPFNPNYVLCVSYRIGGVVTRYILWNAIGSNMNQTIPVYTGQLIKKNFRFEIWNTSQGIASQAASINYFTSVLNSKDYRYGVDTNLVSTDSPCILFKSVSLNLPLVFPTTSISQTN